MKIPIGGFIFSPMPSFWGQNLAFSLEAIWGFSPRSWDSIFRSIGHPLECACASGLSTVSLRSGKIRLFALKLTNGLSFKICCPMERNARATNKWERREKYQQMRSHSGNQIEEIIEPQESERIIIKSSRIEWAKIIFHIEKVQEYEIMEYHRWEGQQKYDEISSLRLHLFGLIEINS